MTRRKKLDEHMNHTKILSLKNILFLVGGMLFHPGKQFSCLGMRGIVAPFGHYMVQRTKLDRTMCSLLSKFSFLLPFSQTVWSWPIHNFSETP